MILEKQCRLSDGFLSGSVVRLFSFPAKCATRARARPPRGWLGLARLAAGSATATAAGFQGPSLSFFRRIQYPLPRRDAACAGTTDGALLLNLRLISWGKGFQPPWFFDGSINGGRIYYFIIGSHLLSPFSYPLLSTLLCRGYRRRVTTLSLQCDRRT